MTAYRGELVAGVADEHAGLAHRAVPHRDALYELGHAHLLRFFFFFLLLPSPSPQAATVIQKGAGRRNRDKGSTLVFLQEAKAKQMEATV
jgi:hypothetical protein